jgi:hypothetical protein
MSCVPSSLRPTLGAGVLAIALSGGVLATARAEEACPVHVSAGASASWTRAAVETRRAIQATAPSARDCRRIDVEVTDDGATLTFVTLDGRTARRRLRAASELRPVVEGLLVTVAMGTPDRPVAAVGSSASAPSSSASASASASTDPAAAPSTTTAASTDEGASVASASRSARGGASASGRRPDAERPRGLVLGGAVGGRLGLKNTFYGANVGVDVGYAIDDWELAALGLYEPFAYESSKRAETGSHYWAVGGGLRAGRRAWLDALGFSYATYVDWLRVAASSDASATEIAGELRVGVSGAVTYPIGSAMRLRLALDADYAPSRHGQVLLTGLPRWGVGLSLGVETWVR